MSLEICRICFNKNEEYIEIFSNEGYRRNVKAIVEQHFWFKIKQEDEDSKQICSICWQIIESFHNFYTKINNIHNSLIPKSSFESHFVKLEVDVDNEHEYTTEIKTETYEINEVLDDRQPIVADEDFDSNDSNVNDDFVSEYASDESETESADGDEEIVRTNKIGQARKRHGNQSSSLHKKRKINYMDNVDRSHVCGVCNKSFKPLVKQDHLTRHTVTNKEEVIETVVINALGGVLEDDEKNDDEIDEILDQLVTDILCISQFRYGYRNDVPKSCKWILEILHSYDDGRFKTMMRVTRQQFDFILEKIQNCSIFSGINSHKQLPLSLQLCIVLYRLGGYGNQASVRKTAAHLGVGDGGTLEKITKRVFTAISGLKNEFLRWPTSEERRTIVSTTNHEMPGCVGYIDGSEIRLAEAPAMNPTDYWSRKGQYSIKLQAVCDFQKTIRYVTIGYPGSVHDARIFRECNLGRNINNFLSTDEWLAGDSAYKLSKTMIIPYRQNTHVISEKQGKFNKHFNSFRIRIEHVFELMKERFQSLKEMRFLLHSTENHQYLCNWIEVCCILHNIITTHSGSDDVGDIQVNDEQQNDEHNPDDDVESDQIEGEKIRQMVFHKCIDND